MVKGKEVSATEDSSSPYYLHPSDNPGAIIVAHQLTGSNYINWSRSMVTALQAKNKLSFVDGSLSKPDENDEKLSIWLRCNSMVVSWLRNSINEEIGNSIMYMDVAEHVWEELRERYSQGDLARVYQLRIQLMSHKQGTMDVGKYYSSLRSVWDGLKEFQPSCWCTCGLCTCNSSKKWSDYLVQDCSLFFLQGLNNSFAQLRSQLLSTPPLPHVSKIFALAVQEERQKSIDSSNSQSDITSAVSEQPSPLVNAAQSYGRGKFTCTHCGRNNHTVDRCFELHGFPPSFSKGRGKPIFQSGKYAKRSVNLVENDDSEVEQGSNSENTCNLNSIAEQCQQLMTMLQSQLSRSLRLQQ